MKVQTRAKRRVYGGHFAARMGRGSRILFGSPAAGKISIVPTLTEPAVKSKQEFVVVKKSTGEVMGTFDLRDDAVAMIEKAKKQKKASLMLLDTAA